MSLKHFHALFIALSALLALGFAVWCWSVFNAVGSMGYLLAALVSGFVALVMVAYLPWFLRKMTAMQNALVLAALTVGVLSDTAQACAVCYGNANSAMTRGMNMGIISLLFVVVAVLSVFAYFFVQLIRRSHS